MMGVKIRDEASLRLRLRPESNTVMIEIRVT